MNDGSSEDSTKVLLGDPETLKQELQKAKDQEACLIVIRGSPQGHRYFLTQESMSVGRDPSADITVQDQSISRKHAQLRKHDGAIWLSDLGSANGTHHNDRKLSPNQEVQLSKEDMIKMGNYIFKYLPAGELEILFYGNLGSAAHTDPLTKAYNKGYLAEALDAEFKRAKALHADLSVIFFDLDHFKKVNDQYGHDAGDHVLKEVTQLVRSQFVRPKDVFARYGGEEFVIVLGNTPIAQAETIAEKLRAAIQAHSFMYEDKRLPVTTSIGVAEVTGTIDSPQSLLKAADGALYQAKNAGRNRVVSAG